MTRTEKIPRRKRDSNPGSAASEVDTLTARPARRLSLGERCCGFKSLYYQIHDAPV